MPVRELILRTLVVGRQVFFSSQIMVSPEDRHTIRQAIIDLLSTEKLTVRELSQTLHLAEKEIMGHLEHIGLTLQSQGRKLQTTPYRCLSCGFVFGERTRLTKPGRCPKCRNSHIQTAQFFIK